jgi:hypothetical protein
VVDWVPSRPERPEGLIVVYDGGVLAPGEVAAITLQDGELGGYEFVKPGEVAERVSPAAGPPDFRVRGRGRGRDSDLAGRWLPGDLIAGRRRTAGR